MPKPASSTESEELHLRAVKALRREGMTPRQVAAALKISLPTYYRRAARLRRAGASLALACAR